jgi:catechol 2,3-dioxygenase-like lactoylglutathione lyase family enzyme
LDNRPPSVKAFFPSTEPTWPQSVKAGALDHIDQISILVRDIDAAIEYFGAAFGWAPFYIVTINDKGSYKNQFSSYCLKAAFCLVGNLEIELLQLIEGYTPHVDHLREKGEGFFHLRLKSNDMDSDLAHLAEQGIHSIWDYVIDGELVNAYTDSHLRFGVRTELIRSPEELSELVKKKKL